MTIVGINHVSVLVRDKKRAEKFYTQTLGLEKVTVSNRLWIKAGNQYIHITEDSGTPPPHSFAHFALMSENLHEQVRQLIAKGLEVFAFDEQNNKIRINTNLDAPQQQFFIHDPDGNLIELIDANNTFFTTAYL